MNSAWCWSTTRSVSLHYGLPFRLLVLSPLKINEVCILLQYQHQWFSTGKTWFWPPPYRPRISNQYHLVCSILLSFFVFGPDSMYRTLHSRIQCVWAMNLHHSIILSIIRPSWKQPHRLITPVIEWMQSWCSCDLKFESNFRIHSNVPAHTVFSLVPMGLIRNPKTACTVGELAVTSGFRSGSWCIIQHTADIPTVLWRINTGVEILVGEIHIFGVQHVPESEISCMCHLFDDSLEGLSDSGHCNHQDWFGGWHMCRMPVRWCCLDLQQAAGHRIEYLEWIPLPFFTNNAGKVIVLQNHPLFTGIPPYNGLWQPHHDILSNHFAKHCRCNWGESLSKTHFILHKCSWHIAFPNPPHHDEPDGPNLVRQKLSSRQLWNWILLAWNMVLCWLTNRMSIEQPDCLVNTLAFKFVVDCTENRIQYWAGICWIEDLLIILHLLLNLPCTFGWVFSSSIITFSCSDVSWADGLISWRYWNSSRC